MSESVKLCVLTIDEMSIKPGYRYAADLDCVDGFTSFQEDCKGRPPYATLALVFMARGIVKNWKQVIGYYFTSPTDKFSLKGLVEEAIDVLQSCQLEVASIVCDQSPKNKGLFKELKVTTEKPYFIHKAKKIYAMVDPPHLLKSVRNNLKNHGIYYEDSLVGNTPRTCYANWEHIEKL
ncbi:unnamed protein product [Larinioides sclopetarius]|uniref:Transposable element P transposase-like RNase H domain-containing protein n=1 Tax=Larinioides sclopetarius TaxID=280406 RepID=A0AAV2BX12_9ARAC